MRKQVISLVSAIAVLVGVCGSVTAAPPTEQPAAAASLTQPYEWGRVATVGGGFVPGIIYNASEKDLVYVRTDIGGAYRWNKETNSWKQLLDWVGFDEWNMAGVESLATDPVDPNRVYIAAGTYSNFFTDQNGVMLRSSDRGETWQRTTLPFKFGGNMPGRSMGERLVIDPNDNSVLYFGTRNGNGLWRSADYGATWSKVESFTPGQNVKDYYGGEVGPVWIAFDQSTGGRANAALGQPAVKTQTIYVGVADTDNSIYKSTDGGATWAPVAGQPHEGFVPHHGVLASNGLLYVTYNSAIGPYDGPAWNGTKAGSVWKLDTANGEWTEISPPVIAPTDPAGVPSYPFGGLAVDPQHPDTVMVATMNMWWPDEHIFRSSDGGATWTSLWKMGDGWSRVNEYTLDYSQSPWIDWGRPFNPTDVEQNPKMGWMIGDLEIDPFNSDRLMYGTGATLFKMDNLGALDRNDGSTVSLSVNAQGIEETSVVGLISPPEGAHLLSAMRDIGGFRHTDLDAAPTMITNPYIGNSTDIDYAELNPSLIVRVGNAENADARMGVSTDNGVTWTPAANAWASADGDKTQGGYVAVGADGASIVWAPRAETTDISRPVSYSKDHGLTWTVSAGVPDGAMVSADRVNPSKFYAISGGSFYVSSNGGASFAKSAGATGLPTKLSGKFKAVPGKEGDIWVAAARDGADPASIYGIFRSTDSGATFRKLAGVEEAPMIGFGKAAPGQTYPAIYINGRIDGKFGLYRSDDASASWIRINDDRHQYANATDAITGDPRVYGRVYIATNGFGIVRGDINGDIVIPPPVEQVTGSKVTVKATAGPDGKTVADVSADSLRAAAAHAKGKAITVSLEATGAKAYALNLPAGALEFLKAAKIETVTLEMGGVKTDVSTDLLGHGRDRDRGPSLGKLQMSVSLVDPSTLSDKAKDRVDGNPVYELKLTVDGGQVDWHGNPIEVFLPYMLKNGEREKSVTVVSLKDNGDTEIVKSAKFDRKSGYVIFKPKQLGKFAAVNDEKR